MNSPDPKLCEQLCTWMDGELSAEEGRFLERRLQHEPELRRQWQRLQLASVCIKGQAWQPMPADLGERVLAAISTPDERAQTRRPLMGWAIAAAIAALAVLIGVQTRPVHNAATSNVVARAVETPASLIASPASADLVATNISSTTLSATVRPRVSVKVAAVGGQMLASQSTHGVAAQSPMPLDTQSPTDFPLAQTSAGKSWPRSPLASGSDASMEAYLVRHNEMVSDGGLGGFVPYVDVVTRERDEVAETGNTGAQGSEGNGK